MYRYASTLGPRYTMPTYFRTREAAEAHHARCQQYIGDLPGQDTMRIEEIGADGQWHALDQEAGQ